MEKFYLQIYRHTLSPGEEETWVDIKTLEIHPEVAGRLAELGIVEISRGQVPARQVSRLRKLMRLRRNLGVNLAGAAIILDLLERVELLEDEVERLKKMI
ncbi:MAG: chaperone modulator CbpM [Bacillota bacterium]